jgi:cell division protein FtsB
VSIKNLNLSKLILIAFCMLIPLFSWLIFGERGLLHLYHAELDRQEYMDRIRSLAEENQALLAEIQRLRNDMKYVELLARKELNMVKENETVYRLGGSAGHKNAANEIGAGNDSESGIPGRHP